MVKKKSRLKSLGNKKIDSTRLKHLTQIKLSLKKKITKGLVDAFIKDYEADMRFHSEEYDNLLAYGRTRKAGVLKRKSTLAWRKLRREFDKANIITSQDRISVREYLTAKYKPEFYLGD